MATEKRLIDANAFYKALYEKPLDFLDVGGDFGYFDETIENTLNEQPTVDAVEVVRCKDCKHWHEETGWCNEHSHFVDRLGDFCYQEENCEWKMFDSDYFCKDGERKDNEKG